MSEQAKSATVTEEPKEAHKESKAEGSRLEKKEGRVTTSLSSKLASILKEIESLTVLELSELVKALEEKFGVSAAAAMAVAAPGAGAAASAGAQPAAEEKASFTVVLAASGAQKIQVIKELRAVTTLGLKEAKDLVEAAPKTIKEGASKEDAEKIKAALEKVGAKVELK